MKLDKALYQRSHLYFIFFFVLVIVAFWVTYFSKIFNQENYRMHTHGITLVLWCLMLISQPYLILTKRIAWHKRNGKLSYVLVPLMVLTTLDLLKYKLSDTQILGTMDYFFIALVINALIAFLLLYGLALYFKKRPAKHGRYMICTVFPMVTPVTDRIIQIYFPSFLAYLPKIEGNPIAPTAGFLFADLILAGLSIWDWRSHKRWNVFPFALIILLLYHYSVLNFYRFDFWKTFSQWFFEL